LPLIILLLLVAVVVLVVMPQVAAVLVRTERLPKALQQGVML
jgi:hypothetical protein